MSSPPSTCVCIVLMEGVYGSTLKHTHLCTVLNVVSAMIAVTPVLL